jgi:peptide/nickel transport system ATP-binding protein
MVEDALAFSSVDVAYRIRGTARTVLRGLTFHIRQGEAYGLVGESSCGKSTAAFAAVHYLPRNGAVAAGRIEVNGQDLTSMGARELRALRQSAVAMVYQDPGRALNPSMRIGRQIAEIFTLAGMARDSAMTRSAEMLDRVRISDPRRVMERYPHQLSGGMQQRVAIAMALARNPALLILDEPTTGLDVTVEAEVLDLIEKLRFEFDTAILFISHNLAIVARLCERTGVLYSGRLVEEGPTRSLFESPRHPYTVGLLRCLPRPERRKTTARLDTIPGFPPMPGAAPQGCIFTARCALATERCRLEEPPLIDLGGRFSRCHYHQLAGELPRAEPTLMARPGEPSAARPILRIENLSKTYRVGDQALAALREVSLDLHQGETLGLVGESGSGKTTLARSLLGLTAADPKSRIIMDGRTLPPRIGGRAPEDVKALQIVFQNPDSALNRSHAVRRLIGRTIAKLAGLGGTALQQRLLALTRSVQLPDRYLPQKPRALSGGLKQRVAIARAFAGEPRVVVCDEPTSALDVSVQAAILNLLADLQTVQGVSYIFISHDLGVIRYLADRIAVLYLGRIVEIGPAERVFHGPQHPYTAALLSAVPDIGGGHGPRIRLQGEIPSALEPPTGCVFQTRCPRKIGRICETEEPPLSEAEPRHAIRCHIPPAELMSRGG